MNAYIAAMWGGLAASTLIIGAFIALRFNLSNRLVGAVMGFGSGALLGSIAYELVPESLIGNDRNIYFAFALGALIFFVGDWLVDRWGGKHRKRLESQADGGSGTAIFLGTLLDGLPESLTLGIGLASGGSINLAFLTAIFISNLPEGVAGTKSLVNEGHSPRQVYLMWGCLVIASALAAAMGFAVAYSLPTLDGQYMQAFAAGAMLTMLADVMMPEAFAHGGKTVGLLTALGFLMAAILSSFE